MNDTILDYISNITDIDKEFIDMNLSFDELHLDIEDIKELLITIEDDFEIKNASSIINKLSVDDSLTTLIDYLEELN